MGESSAKSLRGGEMEDVIFAGSMARPARNLAEVTITLTETAGLAPVPFQAEPELQISRKIERGSGSVYRVNGRETRARDVATLFADLASGARNSAMISQGRVSALVNARPEERRSLLEEAAGISGLHARRHEAELKLRAAEQNLLRVDDLRGQQEVRLAELRKQARQANRYRSISDLIRNAETEYLAIDHTTAEQRQARARSALASAEATVQTAETARDTVIGTETEHSAALPEHRARESTLRTRLERARIETEQIDAEIARLQAARTEAQSRLTTLKRDHDHATRVAVDALAATTRLNAEHAALSAEQTAYPALAETAHRASHEAAETLRRCEDAAQSATEALARLTALQQTIDSRLKQARDRAAQARKRAADAVAAHETTRQALIRPERITEADAAQNAAQTRLTGAEQDVVNAQEDLRAAETTRTQASQIHATARSTAIESESAAARVRAETSALEALLAQKFGREKDAILDAVTVPAGLETALGAALRDELSASTDTNAARHWQDLPPLPAQGALPRLSGQIQAPTSLRRALDHIVLLPAGADGSSLQATLTPGQILVSAEGAIWRWDGFVANAGAPTEAAVRLAQRNRLAELTSDLAIATTQASQDKTDRLAADAAEQAARKAEEDARVQRRRSETALDAARSELRTRVETAGRLKSEAERLATREATAAETRARMDAEASEAQAALAAAESELSSLDDATAVRKALEEARAELAAARQQDSLTARAVQNLASEAARREQRIGIIVKESTDWAERAQDADQRTTDLAARLHEATTTLDALAKDAGAAERHATARTVLDEARRTHDAAIATLEAAEEAARSTSNAARSAELDVARAREARITAESALREADHAWGTVAERILERLGHGAALPTITDPTPEGAERARKRFERLTRERDEMGPVNLRAEIEVGEIEMRLAAIERDRDEITSATAKLRGSIGHLNREGRERLSAVFTEIDRHFRALFTRMFGGGRAHLALTGSDDPLEAGLEIFAEPPGKKLATLMLLSGGEQALTALSLIFAVFRCNPAPISVLDEVDAPLDDANVERFCLLLEDMARETGTRFLVVTHHHLTMARMDRLYGVTMQERGISRLLSVNLGTATALVDQPGVLAAE